MAVMICLLAAILPASAATKSKTPASKAAPSLDIKGIRPGLTAQEFHALLPDLKCDVQPAGQSDCAYHVWGAIRTYPHIEVLNTIAEQIVEFWSFIFLDGRLASVSVKMDTESHKPIVEGLEAKYGKPRITQRPVQTKAGATFPSAVYTWASGPYTLEIEQFALNMNSSILILSSAEFRKRSQELSGERGARRAKDL